MVHRRGKDDLGAGGAQLLELQNQVLQLCHAAAADLDQKGVRTGNVVALQHLAAVLQQLQKGRPIRTTMRFLQSTLYTGIRP